MIPIKRRKNEDIERLINRFKKECLLAGINHEYKRNRYHITETEKRNKRNEAKKFMLKKAKEREAKLKLKKNLTKRRGKR